MKYDAISNNAQCEKWWTYQHYSMTYLQKMENGHFKCVHKSTVQNLKQYLITAGSNLEEYL